MSLWTIILTDGENEMTIQVEIKNNDSRFDAVISVETINPDMSSASTMAHLKGGQTISRYVYEGQNILIKEVKE